MEVPWFFAQNTVDFFLWSCLIDFHITCQIPHFSKSLIFVQKNISRDLLLFISVPLRFLWFLDFRRPDFKKLLNLQISFKIRIGCINKSRRIRLKTTSTSQIRSLLLLNQVNWSFGLICVNVPHCLKIPQNVSYVNLSILAFSTNFCPIELTCNTVWPQASGFQ